MSVITAPLCPGCKQSFTGVYRGRRGCARCASLGPVVTPKAAVRTIAEALPTVVGAEHEVTTGVEAVATGFEQLAANATSVAPA